MKKIYIGADSAGYELKEKVKEHLREDGYTVVDCGCKRIESNHYPEYASKVCLGVLSELDSSFGILICGTGIGMSMCANKFNGIRAALCSDTFSARMTRLHNDANVLCLGARVIGEMLAYDIVEQFLNHGFEGGRHAVRLEMMREIERDN